MTNEELLKEIEEAKASGETVLCLRGNQFTALPSEICQLTKLEVLDLSDNQLTALPSEIAQLRNLKTFHIWDNQLTTLQPELFQLTSLIRLDLRYNQLTSLPPELFQLIRLTRLYLSGNQLITLPPELFQLTRLTMLDLRHNQLTALPSEICQLTNLEVLYLSDNQLTSLPPEIAQLRNLQELYLGGNQLTTLPPEICRLTKLIELELDGNPLTSPPQEIADKGIKAIRRYFTELEKSKQPLNEVKLLLVGEGSAGKTSLVKQLFGQPFDRREDTTHGINIQGWEQECGGKQIRVNIWDFGGQEIQHATHQFFLSRRSLYVLVLDGRKDERTEYWLRHIEAFGGGSPVLIVLNKMDSNPSFDVNRLFLREKYPGIRGFFPVSCREGTGVADFKEALLAELVKVRMLETVWPGSWFAVKRRMERMDRPYISAKEYRGFCAEAGIAEEESRETLVGFLHDLGVAVHFKEFLLDAMHVLDPLWVTEAVYRIITAKEMAESGGVLRLNALKEILKDRPAPRFERPRTVLRLPRANRHCCPAETHPFIMRLMEKFELCYELDRDSVLIPQLLPVQQPRVDFRKDGALRFALHYPDFLPPSVFPRFMVKVHKDINARICWRTGVLLADNRSGTQALVKADMEARRINIRVRGERPREYLHYLRYTLTDINSGFEKLTVMERVPMPDDPHASADYQTLLEYAEAGSDLYIAEGSKKRYSVHELLGLVQPTDKIELVRLADKTGIESADEAFWLEMINDLFELKPSLLGITFNLHGFFKELLDRQKQKRG